MKNPFFSITHIHSLGWLLFFTAHLLLSFVVAFALGRKRTIGFLRSFIVCVMITAPVGCVIILFYPTLKQRQHDTDLSRRIADPFTKKDYLHRLKIFRQTGMISKAEYEAEKKRIIEAEYKNPIQRIIIEKPWKRQA